MKRFSLFGSTAQLDDVVEACSSGLGLEPRMHDSDYVGGEYFRFADPSGSTFEVKKNAPDEDGVVLEPEFAQWSVLVYESDAIEPTSPLAEVDLLVLLREECL